MYSVDNTHHLYLTLMKTSIEIITQHYNDGDIELVKNFGIDDYQLIRNLDSLKHSELSKLCQFTIPVIDPRINVKVLKLAIKHIKQESARDSFYDELITHGATLEIVQKYTTIDKLDFTRRRKKLQLINTNMSKTRVTNNEEKIFIDDLWGQLPDNMPEIEKYLFSAKKLKLSIIKIHTHLNNLECVQL